MMGGQDGSRRNSRKSINAGSGVDVETMQKQYRMMEENQAQYNKETQAILRKQMKTIKRIKDESEQIKEQIAVLQRQQNSGNMAQIQTKIADMQDQADQFTKKIEVEKRLLEEIDKQLKVGKARLEDKRQFVGGVNASKESTKQTMKQIRILENRLDKALVKFNESLSFNKTLRDEIDNLRRERVVFDNIYKKLGKELQEKKASMAEKVELSNLAYEARDQALAETTALRTLMDKEQSAFEDEWSELGRQLETDKKSIKDIGRGTPAKDARGDLSKDDEDKLRKKLVKGSWGLAKDKVSKAVVLERVQSYEEAFNRIQASTGIADIDELVTSFIEAEDKNFSLYNYVNEMNNEVEKLEEQNAELRVEIEKYKGQGGNTENQRKKLLKDLEDKLAKTEAKAAQYEEKALKATKTVESLISGIQNIFNRLGLNQSSVVDMLGDDGVTENNMMKVGTYPVLNPATVSVDAPVKAVIIESYFFVFSNPWFDLLA
uniref:ODAD1 central coiled coil region domain-containing protein n=1 Tax=Palpitomonas bilix TaxID=652834 RepID=A0A7S3FZ83_9EUKA|mmetsp:Transcript_15591/g.39509  ORF Transcript_15591/g.39509 Transcript_15591/m.39509 type:complete len:490 (+) Transcript_15591:487-1956(+)